MIDGNTKHDDGGDKLGLCEGFEIKGPKIFMSGKLKSLIFWIVTRASTRNYMVLAPIPANAKGWGN